MINKTLLSNPNNWAVIWSMALVGVVLLSLLRKQLVG